MNLEKRNIFLIVGVVIILILASIVYSKVNKDDVASEETALSEQMEPEDSSSKTEEAASTTLDGSTRRPASTKSSQTGEVQQENFIPGLPPGTQKGKNLKADAETYQNALNTFGDYRIQIENCRANPTQLTVKNGREILVDGFAEDPQLITVGNKKILLEGYDAKVVKVEGKPQETVMVTCEQIGSTQYNIGKIIVMP